MDILVEKLDKKLREWKPNTIAQVRQRIMELIELADNDALDIIQSRSVEQEVLNLLDSQSKKSLFGYMKDSVAIHDDILKPIEENWEADEF